MKSKPNIPEGPREEVAPGGLAAAIARVAPNSTLLLKEGTYNESIVLDKPLKFVARGAVIFKDAGRDIITSRQYVSLYGIRFQASSPLVGLNIQGGCAIVDCCNFQDASLVLRGEGQLWASDSTFRGLELSGLMQASLSKCNVAGPGIGIACTGRAHLELAETVISNCGDSGIVTLGECSVSIQNCQISKCKGIGLEFSSSTPGTVMGTVFAENEVGMSCNSRISSASCKFSANRFGVGCYGSGVIELSQGEFSGEGVCHLQVQGGSCQVSGSTFTGAVKAGISVMGGSLVLDNCHLMDLTGSGIAAKPGTSLTLIRTNIQKVGENGVEAVGAQVSVTETQVSTVGKVGLLIVDGSKGLVKSSVVGLCGKVCVFIRGVGEFSLAESRFCQSSGNGIEVVNSGVTVATCEVLQNAMAGIEIKGSERCQLTTSKFQENLAGAILHGAVACSESWFQANGRYGLILNPGASCEFSNCAFSQNGEMGIFANAAAATFVSSAVQQNVMAGIHVEGAGGQIVLRGCDISGQTAGRGVVLNGKSQVSLEGANVYQNTAENVLVQGEGSLKITRGDICSSGGGMGVVVSQARAVIEEARLHDEGQSSVVVHPASDVQVRRCEVFGCQFGVCFLSGSTGVLETSVVRDNSVCGVRVSGTPRISGNQITSHAKGRGIWICEGGTPSLGENQFAGNGLDVDTT